MRIEGTSPFFSIAYLSTEPGAVTMFRVIAQEPSASAVQCCELIASVLGQFVGETLQIEARG
jgi:hypothetical protein